MARRPDDLELLGLIEGDLDASRCAAVERAVAGDAELSASLRDARVQRSILRSLAAPMLPCDFVGAMEGDLAPSAPFVRLPARRGRMSLAATWPPLALAAVLGAAATGGIWMASTWMRSGDRATSPEGIAANGTNADGAIADPAATRGLAGAAGDRSNALGGASTLPPIAGASDGTSVAVAPPRPVDSGDAARGAAIIAAESARADVAMVIEAVDVERAIAALRAIVDEDKTGTVALVRNFTTAQALALVNAMNDDGADRADRRARTGLERAAGERAFADRDAAAEGTLRSMSPAQRDLLEQAMAAITRHNRGAGALAPAPVDGARPADRSGTSTSSRLGDLLAGSPAAAPAPEAQLEFGDHGFDLTLTVPAEQFAALLVRLADQHSVATVRLQRRNDAQSATAAASDASRWQGWRDVVRSASASGRVVVPIRVVQPRR